MATTNKSYNYKDNKKSVIVKGYIFNIMASVFKEWLRLAYQKEDPTTFLYNFLNRPDHKKLTVGQVNKLISEIVLTISPSNNTDSNLIKYNIPLDIEEFRAKIERDGKPSHEVLAAQFCYFATALTHVWLDSNSGVLPVEQPIIAFFEANKPIPYVWFNVNPKSDTKLELIKHTFDKADDTVVRVIVHIVERPGALMQLKLSFDLETTDCLSTMRGDFMQIALRLDEKTAYLQSPSKGRQCLVVLTYDQRLTGIFYNNGQENTVVPCYYSVHYY